LAETVFELKKMSMYCRNNCFLVLAYFYYAFSSLLLTSAY